MLFFHRLLFLLAGVSAASLFALADIRLPLREDNDVSMGSHTEELDSTRVRRNIPSCHTSGMATPSIAARTHGIRTNEDALNTCGSGEQVCGTYQGSSAFECVNTDTALESCGGCIAPNPFISAEEQGPEGLDCTMIPHVRDVKCESGKCVVGGCDDGFRPSNDRETCIPSRLFA